MLWISVELASLLQSRQLENFQETSSAWPKNAPCIFGMIRHPWRPDPMGATWMYSCGLLEIFQLPALHNCETSTQDIFGKILRMDLAKG
jgi:hypothetical protein